MKPFALPGAGRIIAIVVLVMAILQAFSVVSIPDWAYAAGLALAILL